VLVEVVVVVDVEVVVEDVDPAVDDVSEIEASLEICMWPSVEVLESVDCCDAFDSYLVSDQNEF
jgi:hypothetical protein